MVVTVTRKVLHPRTTPRSRVHPFIQDVSTDAIPAVGVCGCRLVIGMGVGVVR